MSTKKDKFSTEDKNYMKLALNLARARKGLTGDNPSVGCVIVKNNQIISIGQTGYNGRPHAEYNAIKNSFQNLNGSKIYVTLEPCNHYGKTPPCTNQIIRSGISEVYYSINDIDKKVKGKSFKILKKNRIKVFKGLLKNEAKDLYESYILNRQKKIPYVTGKIAISKNNIIYRKGIKRISDTISERLTHYLRFKHDAILISSRTLNIDNPKLNCRLKGYEIFSPKRVILDRNLEIDLKSFIFRSTNSQNTIIFHGSSNMNKVRFLRKKGFKLILSKIRNDKTFDLTIILKKLFNLGVRSLLVEGGDKLTQNFIKDRLFNQFFLFSSSKKISTKKKYVIFTSLTLLKKLYKNRISSSLAKDNITIYKR